RNWARGISAALDRAGIIHGGQRDPGGWGWDEHRLTVFNALKKLERVPSGYGHSNGSGLTEYTGGAAEAVNLKFTADEFAELLEHANARVLAVTRSDAEDIAEEARREEERKSIDDLEEIVEPVFFERYTAGAGSIGRLTKDDLSDGDLTALKRALPRYDHTVRDTHTIRVLTIHASKGSEASDVIVYDGITSKIAREMERDPSTGENEARTWYVALSRASERLHIMYGAFPGAIDRLPRNLAQNAAATAQRRATAVTDGGDPQ
ncbi:MAG: 3'-5' exonuclease, partial [Halobacteriota archaeon]